MDLKYNEWSKISVNKYNELNKVLRGDYNTGDFDLDLIDQHIDIISVLNDSTPDEIGLLTPYEFGEYVKELSFLKKMPRVDINTKYILNGKEYNVFLEMRDMNISQFIDFQTLYKDKENKMKELLACFVLPKGRKYGDGYDIMEVINDIGEYMCIVDANSILFFFTLLYRSLLKAILNYYTSQLKKLMKREENREKANKMRIAIQRIQQAMSLIENGDGHIM